MTLFQPSAKEKKTKSKPTFFLLEEIFAGEGDRVHGKLAVRKHYIEIDLKIFLMDNFSLAFLRSGF